MMRIAERWRPSPHILRPPAGFVRSNPTTERQWQAMGQDGQTQLVESIALRRLGTPADIVHGVLFFADFAAWITGQVLSVDGGR